MINDAIAGSFVCTDCNRFGVTGGGGFFFCCKAKEKALNVHSSSVQESGSIGIYFRLPNFPFVRLTFSS